MTLKDRKPTLPNRYLVTPESGSSFYAVLARADEPTEHGTPLNAGNLTRFVYDMIDSQNYEHWQFTLEDGSQVVKAVVLK